MTMRTVPKTIGLALALLVACDGGDSHRSNPVDPNPPRPPVVPEAGEPDAATCFVPPFDGAHAPDGCLAFLERNPNFDNDRHAGDDLCAPAGTPVVAIASGRVMFARDNGDCPNWGHLIAIEHRLPDGSVMTSLSGHVIPSIPEGAIVEAGERIGSVGTYPCWRDHVHFAIALRDYGAPIGEYSDWVRGYLREESDPVEPWTDPLVWVEGRPACGG